MIFYLKSILFGLAVYFGLTTPNPQGERTKEVLTIGALYLTASALPKQEQSFKLSKKKSNSLPKLGNNNSGHKFDLQSLVPTVNEDSQMHESDPMSDLITKGNEHPHIMIVGKSGGGKTSLVQYLSSYCKGKKFAIAPHFDPVKIETEWACCDGIFGIGRNYGSPSDKVYSYEDIISGKVEIVSVYQALASIINEMKRRYCSTDGFEAQETHHWFIDEAPSIASSQGLGKSFSAILAPLVYEARKVNIRLWLLTQNDQVKSLGIAGEGKIRDNFTYIYLSDAAKQKHRELKGSDNFNNIWEWCIVNDKVSSRPSLERINERISENINENRFISKFPVLK